MKRFLLIASPIIGLFSLCLNAEAQTNQTVTNGASTTAVNFPGTGCTYNWVNNTPGIGLAASGTGNIASFTAVNNGSTPVTATITATPANQGFAYITNSGEGTVSVINIATHTVVGTITVGSSPWGDAVSPDGSHVYVTNQSSNTVSVINTATKTVTSTISVGSIPIGVTVTPDGSKVYVANSGAGTVSVINASANTVTATVAVGSNPFDLIVSPDGSKVYVSNTGSGTVSVINTATNTVSATISIGTTAFCIAISPDGSKLYVSNSFSGSVTVVNTTTNTIAATIPIGAGSANCLVVSLDGSKVYANLDVGGPGGLVAVINTATNSVTTTIGPLGSDPSGLWISPDGSEVYSTIRFSNYVSVINTSTNTVATTVNVGSGPLSVGNFISGGTGCAPVTFTITVNPTPLITAGTVTGTINTCAGTASVSPNIQQFTVSGSHLTADITATAPAGFEVSLATGSGYGNTATLMQTGGSVSNIPVYVRSSASATGNISGNVVLTSTGATTQNVAVTGIVNVLPTVNTVSNQTVVNGAATATVNFTGTANTFNWTNDTPGIGLAASGTGNIASFTAVNAGSSPVVATVTVTPASTSFAYVGNSADNTVSVINTGTNAVVATIGVGNYPWGVSKSPDGSKVYITNFSSGNVSVINTLTNTVSATITVGLNPYGIALTPNGNFAYVANAGSGTVSVINTVTNSVVATLPVAGAIGIAISPDGNFAYVAASTKVFVINTSTNTVATTIATGLPVFFLAVNPNGSQLYVTGNDGSNKVTVINTATNTVTTTIPVGANPIGLTISTDGSRLYVANSQGATVSVINTATNTVIATVGVGTRPVGLSVSPNGSYVYVVNQISNNVSVINTATNTVISTIAVGSSPISLGNFITNGLTCSGTPTTFTITVDPTLPTITASGSISALTTTYGTPSPSASFNVSGTNMTAGILVTPPPGFEVSTDNVTFSSTVTVGAAGTIAPTTVYIRLAGTTAAGTYSGNVVLTSAGATAVNVATASSTVNPEPMTITASNVTKVYGTTITGGAGSTAYSITGGSLQNGNTITSVSIAHGTGSAATDPVGTYTGSVTVSAATGSGGFLRSNYTITYAPGDIIVTPASLTITASNVTKVYGTTLTGAPGSTAFTATGLQNGETIGSVSIANSTGSAATDPVGTYTGSVTASAATGGTFAPGNYTITYAPGNIIITPAALTITANNVTKTYGSTLTGATGSAAFTATGLQNGESIGSISIAYGTGSAATDPAGTYTGSVTVLAATGSGGFLSSNYTITYAPGDIIVTPASLTITASNVTKVYGTTLTGAPGSTAFTATGLQNGETIGSVSIAYGAGSAATDPVGTYTGSVTISAATGSGGFLSNNYTITYAPGDIIVTPASLTIIASNATKVYGITLSGGTGSAAFTSSGLQNGESISSVSIAYGTGSAATDPAGTYTGSVTASTATGGTFTPGNYMITYAPGDIIVTPATLTITANNVTKTYGAALTGTMGSTAFTVVGLQNGETIGSVTTSYGAGAAAIDPAGTYTGSVTASAATGGTFTAGNYTISYAPGDIMINVAPSPAITAPGGLPGLKTTYGTPSPSESFNVSGTGMTAGILVTPPPGFEVSTDNVTYSSTVTIGTAGTIASAPVYIRLAGTTAAGIYSGNVVLTSVGAVTVNVAVVNSTVNPAPLTVTANNVPKVYGTSITSGPASTAFTITSGALQNGNNISSVSIAYGTGSAATDPVGTYTGSVTASAATGSIGFLSSNYTITYSPGNTTVTPAALMITANNVTKTYGTALTGAMGSAAFTASGLQNSETIGSVAIAYGTGSAATDPAGTYTGSVTASAATGGTFAPGNYTITYPPGDIIITPATLTITANSVTKTYGTALTGATGSTAFTASGLQNSETIGSVTIAYGTGSAATDPAGTYTGSVTISAATGSGGFLSSNYTIIYASGDIIVTGVPAPAIAGTGSIPGLNTIYGTASASTSFNVSGTNMTAGILVTPPPGFEVSTDNVTFSSTVTVGAAGTIAPTTVYIRLAGTTAAGTYSGNVVLTSAGATAVNVATASSTVNPEPMTITASNVTKVYGTTITGGAGSTAFTATGLQNGETIGSVSIAYGTGSAATDPAGTYTGSVTILAATGSGGFLSSNYTITYAPGDIIVTPASLTITASNATKVYGTTLSGGTGSAAFTSSGLQNGESIGSVSIAYGAGSAATDPVGTYTGSVTISAATGSGGFLSNNYTITYAPGDIIVTPATATLVIPNAFTPNGDGINDTWNINALVDYPQCTVSIFTRDGGMIFYSRGYSTPWDGTYKGSPLPFGTYYYVINLQNDTTALSGPVTIIR